MPVHDSTFQSIIHPQWIFATRSPDAPAFDAIALFNFHARQKDRQKHGGISRRIAAIKLCTSAHVARQFKLQRKPAKNRLARDRQLKFKLANARTRGCNLLEDRLARNRTGRRKLMHAQSQIKWITGSAKNAAGHVAKPAPKPTLSLLP